MAIYNGLTELIGNTPLLKLNKYGKGEDLKGNIIVKLEYYNPAGSVKDRIGKEMIEEAEKAGALKPGATIIEPTSGNTGIGLAAVAASKGYKAIFTMPDTMSIERRKLLAAYGAEIVLTPGADGMKGAIAKADELNKEIEGSVIPGQFVNPDNPKAHYEHTGPEIWKDAEGNVDAFVSAVGTGGTLTGTGKYLKEQNPDIKIVAVEPKIHRYSQADSRDHIRSRESAQASYLTFWTQTFITRSSPLRTKMLLKPQGTSPRQKAY